MEAISTKTMYEIEENAHRMGMLRIFMMENAGNGVARHIIDNFDLNNKRVVAIAGTGNNGGDALVASRHLARYTKPYVILLGEKADIKTNEARTNYSILEKMNKSIELLNVKEVNEKLINVIKEADIIIDGIFGIGIKGKIREPHATIIDLINDSSAYKVAVDVPSGLDPDTGMILDKCVKADVTITFHKAKHGLLKSNACGKIIICHIGIPPEADKDDT
ncbi:MAG: hypothetical protein KatS3mg003_1355 [Candidatus Nitrosocaldaceae archaeon]|nr:MAG: hypothetical protein KatS3mg003_1355 [Candidatus Nitrosocaldaceae archaeon]